MLKAKFIGKDFDGFLHGVTYELTSEITEARIGGGAMGRTVPCIYLYDKNGSAFCSYESLETLLGDWEFVKE